MKPLEEQAGLVANGVRDDLPFRKFLGDCRADQDCLDLKQLFRQPGKRLDRQGAMALVCGCLAYFAEW
jgi:hypothetical protein